MKSLAPVFVSHPSQSEPPSIYQELSIFNAAVIEQSTHNYELQNLAQLSRELPVANAEEAEEEAQGPGGAFGMKRPEGTQPQTPKLTTLGPGRARPIRGVFPHIKLWCVEFTPFEGKIYHARCPPPCAPGTATLL